MSVCVQEAQQLLFETRLGGRVQRQEIVCRSLWRGGGLGLASLISVSRARMVVYAMSCTLFYNLLPQCLNARVICSSVRVDLVRYHRQFGQELVHSLGEAL